MRNFNPILAAIAWLMCLSTAFAHELPEPVITPRPVNFTGDVDLVEVAEQARTASYKFWTGRDYPRWSTPCEIKWASKDGGDEGGGGLSISFGDGYVRFNTMTLHGDRQQLIDNVIPHEVDHAVRASLTGHKITRWLDEGLSQLRESEAVQRERAAVRFTPAGDASVWQHMDEAEYPPNGQDVIRVYECGWSVAKYLIETHGTDKVMELQKASPNLFANWSAVFGESPNVTRAKWRRWSNQQGSQRLIMFGAKWCSPCRMFEQEIEATGSPVMVVKESDANFVVLKQAYEQKTGKELDRYPTFWVEGTSESRTVDYQPGLLQRLVGWFGNTVRGIIATVIGQPAPLRPRPDSIGSRPLDAIAQVDLPPNPIDVEELDPANITVIVLAAMQDVGVVKGTARKLAIDKAAGPLERAVNEKIGDKATIILIPQRTQPERFSAVTNAARVGANPAAVLVLVRKQSLGLKSLIAGKVERTLEGKVPDSVPVELIFERVHRDDFNSILTAAQSREVEKYDRDESTPATPAITEDGLAKKLLPLLTSKIGDKLADSDNALLSKLGDKLTPETPPPEDGGPRPSEQGIMGGLGLLIAERLRSMWIKRKTHKAIIEAEAKQATA